MKLRYLKILFASCFFSFLACNKETANTQSDIIKGMLVNKTWYLDYTVMGTSTKSYLGQSTYFVTYLKDGSLSDSDGLKGNYTIEFANNSAQIHVKVKTINNNPLEVVYDIVTTGDNKLVLSKQEISGTPIQYYFTSK